MQLGYDKALADEDPGFSRGADEEEAGGRGEVFEGYAVDGGGVEEGRVEEVREGDGHEAAFGEQGSGEGLHQCEGQYGSPFHFDGEFRHDQIDAMGAGDAKGGEPEGS